MKKVGTGRQEGESFHWDVKANLLALGPPEESHSSVVWLPRAIAYQGKQADSTSDSQTPRYYRLGGAPLTNMVKSFIEVTNNDLGLSNKQIPIPHVALLLGERSANLQSESKSPSHLDPVQAVELTRLFASL